MNKIPVMPAVVEAYAYVFGKLGRVIGLIWLPSLVMTVAGYYALLPVLRLLAGNPDADTLVEHGDVVLGFYGFVFLFLFLLAAIGAAIVRDVLRPGEPTSRFGLPPLDLSFRVFVGYVGIVLMILAAALASDTLASALSVPAIAFFGRLFALVFFIVYPGFLLVPAAIAGGKSGLAQSWRLGKGNVWRLVAVAAATMLPPLLVAGVMGSWVVGPDTVPAPVSDADAARYQAAMLARQADNFPALMCINFLLMPFGCGLPAAAAAACHRALTAKAD